MTYDEFATEVASEYSLFLFALSGAYLARVSPGRQVTPLLVKEFRADARRLSETFFDQLDRSVDSFMVTFGFGDTDSERETAFLNATHGMVAVNLAQINKQMISGSVNFGNVLKNASGAIGLLVQKKLGMIDFKIPDAAGRMWNAETLFRMTARDFAYQTYIDEQVAELRAGGNKLAKVIYPDPTHKNHDGIISLDEEIDGYPTFASVRKVIFHPNANAELTHV